MANKQAWNDRDKLLAILNSMEIYLKSYKTTFESLQNIKNEILDNIDRTKEMKKLIDEDPDWDLSLILNKYNHFKEIYDYLTQ